MQDYNLLKASDLLSASRSVINNNLESVKSNFSGTYFPTQNLAEGMMCWRTDLKKMYQLQRDLTTWTLVFDMSEGQARTQFSNKAVSADKDGSGNNIVDTYYRKDLIARLKDDMYPVGSVIITMTADNPSTWLGGEWQQIAGGRTLIGASSSYRAGATGGSESQNITLSTNNLPAHKHSVTVTGSTGEAGEHTHTRGTMDITGRFGADDLAMQYHTGAFSLASISGYYGTEYGEWAGSVFDFKASRTWEGETSSEGKHSHTLSLNASESNVGGGQAFGVSHMQPYLVTYFWQKVKKAFA